jgi:phage protein D
MPPSATRPALVVDGRGAQDLDAALLELTVEDDGREPSSCTARFANVDRAGRRQDLPFVGLTYVDFGSAVSVTLDNTSLFNGRVSAIDADFLDGTPPTMSIRCHDGLGDLRRSSRTRTFAQVSDADLVRRIAMDHGMRAAVELSGPVHATASQLDQTDLQFLQGRLQRLDGVLWSEGNTLHAAHTPARDHGTVQLTWGQNLRTFHATAAPRKRPSSASRTTGPWRRRLATGAPVRPSCRRALRTTRS